jgi:hypothetical protein
MRLLSSSMHIGGTGSTKAWTAVSHTAGRTGDGRRGRTSCLCSARHGGTACHFMCAAAAACARTPFSRRGRGKRRAIYVRMDESTRGCLSVPRITRAGVQHGVGTTMGSGFAVILPRVAPSQQLAAAAQEPRSRWHRLPDGKGGPATAAA